MQPSGKTIQIHLRGDELLHWTEDSAGYTILLDAASKTWVYATLDAAGQLTASAAVVGEQDPAALALPKRLLPETAIREAQAAAASRAQTAEDDGGPQRAATTGTMKNLVLLVGFSDLPFTRTKAEYEALFNTIGYTADGAQGSVKDFYKEISYNQLNVDSVVVEPVTLANGYAYYGGDGGTGLRPREMVQEALAAVEARGFNFSTVDSDGDGWVDGLTVIHAGGGAEYGGNDYNYIWSHKWSMVSTVTYDGKSMRMYHTEPERRGWDSSPSSWGITRIGVICHENGHFLGLPDLYDYGSDSSGVGDFCLMASGSWNGNSGTQPAQPSAWCKMMLAWLTPTEVTASGTYPVPRVEDNQTVYRLRGAFPSTQYFLIENRQGFGFDASLPGSTRGLLIWHVDETIYNNNDQTHYRVDLEEAGGTQDLELNANSGNDADYFRAGTLTTFNSGTTPNNRSYAGVALGQEITAVSAASATMSFTVSQGIEQSTLQFSSATYSVAEVGVSVRVYVSRTGGSVGAASVSYATANGTATAGSGLDYTAKSGTLSWADGNADDKWIDILINNDTAAEIAEFFTVTLSNPSGALLGTPGATTVTIEGPNDQPLAPANDNFANAVSLSGNSGTVVSNTSSATVEAGEPAHAGVGPFKSIWYTFTPLSNGTFTVNTHGSAFDTVLALYTGSAVGSLTPIAWNDGDGWPNNNSGLTGIALTGGIPCRIALAGYDSSESGATVLNWEFTPSSAFPAPTGVGATDGTWVDRVRATWSAVAGASNYKVYRNTSASTTGAVLLNPAGTTDLFYDDMTALQSVNYYYWVTAVNAEGLASGFSLPDAGYRGGTALPAPEGVVVSRGVYTNRVVIQWQPLAGASHYRVLRANTLGGVTEVITVWVTGTSGTDWDTEPGVSYWYAVQAALDDTGTGVGPSSAQVEGWRKLSPPVGVSASDGTYSVKIAVMWSSVAGASRYRVFRATTPSQADRAAVSGWITATSFNDTDAALAPGVTYYYTVQAAVNSSGGRPSDWSAAAIGRLGYPLPAPLGVDAWDGLALDKVKISWSPVSGATHYKVSRATTLGGALTALTNGWFAGTVCYDVTAIPGKSYYYQVQAATDAADSRASAYSVADEGWRLLSPPTAVAASESFTDRVRVTWTAPAGASYYQVLRGQAAGGGKSALSAWVSGTSFDDTNVLSGIRYYYAVVAAIDVNGLRPSSQSSEDTGWRALLAPAAVTASDGTYLDRVSVDWTPVAEAGFYRVFRSTSSTGTKTALGMWQSETNFADTAATPGVTYYYWVQSAVDVSGTGSGLFSPYNDGWRSLSGTFVTASDDTFSDKVYVTWPSLEGATYYRVYRALQPEGEWLALGSWQSATNYSDTAAQPGTSYWYTVQGATSSSGARPGPQGLPDAGRRALAPPANLVATDGTFRDRVALSWAASVNATYYRLSRGTVAGGPKDVLTGWLSVTNFNDFAAVPGVTFYYSVQSALDEEGLQPSAWSAENDGWRALFAPTPVEASDDLRSDGVMVAWGVTAGASHYRVYRMTTSNAVTRTALSGWIAETNYLDTTATAGVIYYYSVQAATSVAGLRASAYSVEDTGRRALAAPVNIAATDGTLSDKVRITWSAAAGATRYRVLRGDVSTSFAMAPLSAWLTTVTYDDATATPGTNYLYTVQASTDDSGSIVSPNGTSDEGWRGLPAPTWIAASDGDAPLRVSWSTVRGASHYRLYRNTSTSTATRQPLGVWQTGTTYVDTEVTPGLTYYYWVVAAIDSEGARQGTFSAVNDGWQRLCPPDGLNATDGTFADKVRLTWAAAAGASYYKVYRASDGGVAYEVSGWLNTTNYDDSAAEPGVVYDYYVQSAVSSSGGRASLLFNSETGWRAFTAPADIQATDGTRTDTVRIEWAGVAGAGSYRVWRGSTVGGAKTPLSGWLSEAWFEDATALPGVSYFYAVQAAADNAGTRATTPDTAEEGWRGLAAVAWISATDGVHTNKVRVEWGAAAGATHYRVYRATASGGTRLAVSGWQAATGFDDLSAVSGTYYFYTVVAAADDSGAHTGLLGAEDLGWRLRSVETTSGFQEWALARGLGTDLEAVFVGDMDADGVPNGLAYALGANWTSGQPLLRIVVVNGEPAVEVVSQDTATVDDVTVWVETTSSLAAPQWNTDVTQTDFDPVACREQWRTTLPAPAAFFRLRATLNP